ncbi:hypothetical protein OG21DRAFT_1499712 [Imleria badia]|nr:hypothetical protein OG21DRAFT_1499712 [Imleria badia]
MWMSNGTLTEYINQDGMTRSISTCVQLIEGIVSGLAYLHSRQVVHGDLHPGNVLIDDKRNARLTDFGIFQALSPAGSPLFYLCTKSIRPGAVLFAAPELLHPGLYPDLGSKTTLNSDVYSLGSILFLILSGQLPWLNSVVAESSLKERRNPPRPVFPAIPDGVWNFIEQCWSPGVPRDRPSAQKVLSFSTERLEQLLQPIHNVVLFGVLGCGKSSIINLLADQPIAQVSTDVVPCTKRPLWYQMSIGERRFRLWDTMGFSLARGRDTSPLLPYEQAHAVLRNITDGVDLILLCVRKDAIFASLGNLYRLINDFFYGGRAPIAIVVTQFDTPDEGWWARNQDAITQITGIPAQSIPHACITTVQTGCVQPKQVLKELLENYATTFSPVTLRLDLSSTASLRLAGHCRLSIPEATALVERFKRPLRPFNVIIFGDSAVGKSSVINLLAGDQVADVSTGTWSCTSNYRSYKINTGMQQFLVWDTVSFRNTCIDRRRVAESAVELIREVSQQGGVDLLVLCRKASWSPPSELDQYKLFKEFLCEGRVPVAVVVTHLEWYDPMEKWWEAEGEGLVKFLGGGVIGHACITTSLYEPDSRKRNRKLLESRLSVQTMLEDCISSRCTLAGVERISTKQTLKRTGETGRAPKKMTIKNLMDRCRLTREDAEALIKLYYSSG